MKLVALLVLLAGAIASPARARAQERDGAHRVDLGSAVGYATPIGSAERGAQVGDTTIGAVLLQIDAALALTRTVAGVLAVSYAPAIPTLCQSANDCVSSLGSDVAVSLRVRASLPRIGPTVPRVELGSGYEWLTTRLSDMGTTSTRGYDGPLLGVVEVDAPFQLGRRWTLGPALGAMVGVFANEALETSAYRRNAFASERSLHAWLTLSVRLQFSP
jgi:hypothetical protein